MNQVMINGNYVDMNDADYNLYQRLYGPQDYSQYGAPMGYTYEQARDAGFLPAQTAAPVGGNLRDYYQQQPLGAAGQIAGAVGRTGVSTAAGFGAGAATSGMAGPAAGLWLYGMGMLSDSVHGDSFTPDKYKTLTAAGRSHYLDPQGEHMTPTARAEGLSTGTGEDIGQLSRYLSNVQPYEDMAYYNPKTLEGKYRASGLANWAKGRIQTRWKEDLDALDAQDLAKRYNMTVPERYKTGGPFKVDFSGGY